MNKVNPEFNKMLFNELTKHKNERSINKQKAFLGKSLQLRSQKVLQKLLMRNSFIIP